MTSVSAGEAEASRVDHRPDDPVWLSAGNKYFFSSRSRPGLKPTHFPIQQKPVPFLGSKH